MPIWLNNSLSNASSDPAWLLFWRIGAAIALGVAVAGIYRWARRGESTPPTFEVTLILLAGLIAMATQVIGDNVARAFSLVGALSVVRFRTVVKDTQDTAFVIFAVVMGMAAGANHLLVGMIGLLLLVIASPFLWPPHRHESWGRDTATLRLKIEQGGLARAAVEAVFHSVLARQRLLSACTGKKGAALELCYSVRLRGGSSPIELVGELNRIEGVSAVELSRGD